MARTVQFGRDGPVSDMGIARHPPTILLYNHSISPSWGSLVSSEHVERRLAAILAADVVGYSRLMGADELGTFERIRAHRKELFEPEIARHHGRIFKLMGDGLLAEFGSVVDAVSCAVVLQRSMLERNSGISHERRIDVRIGINLGDVIVEDGDRHGDTINLAARLQQLARPNGHLRLR